jgi:hypothetical protein
LFFRPQSVTFRAFIVELKSSFHFLCDKPIKHLVWIVGVGKRDGSQSIQEIDAEVTGYNIGFFIQVAGGEDLGAKDLIAGNVVTYQLDRVLGVDTIRELIEIERDIV